MPKQREDFTYNYETLSLLSGWSTDRIAQDKTRNDLHLGRLEDVCVWLASNGLPKLRAEMARRLLPPVLGIKRNNQTTRELANFFDSPEILWRIFERDGQLRHGRAADISKAKKRRKSPVG